MTSDAPLDPVAGPRFKLTRKQKITIGAGMAIIGAGSVLYFALSNSGDADAGDCLKENGPNILQRVDCDNPDARYKVVGRVDGKSQGEATFSTCGVFKETTDIYWEKSYVLCLGPASK